MLIFLTTLLATLWSIFRSRASLGLENLALRHQIGVLHRSAGKRPKLTSGDRLLWICLSRLWRDWRGVGHGQARNGRSPRIDGELLKLGIDIGQSSVSKYMVPCRKPPSQTWRTFLENHAQQLVSIDFFTVPTIRFQVLYVFLVLAHDRRRIVHCNVTAHPSAEWTGQQLREAFPFAQLPRYLLRDRDASFGDDFREHVRDMGICEVLSAPRAPWQRAYIERVIGSVRRECLDHMIVFHETSLRRTLTSYFDYYHRWRTHLSLRKDAPEPRAIHPPEMGSVVALPLVGGLHHRYERRAA